MRMTRLTRALGLALVAALSAVSGRVSAQVTTGAITGTVTDEQGQPVEAAQIQMINKATGLTRGALTSASGRYVIQGLEVGAQYSVTARRIGFRPTTVDNVVVSLGQTTRADIKIERQATQLEAVTVVSETNAIISPTRTGASTTVGDSALRRLPSLNRNFTDFVALTPQVSNSGPGLSGGGSNNRFNNIQIDGAVSSDLFGLGSTGQPGGQAGGKSISIEAVKEYQVLLSPYDVRQGNFSGALINAVTKGGTNEFHGSVYGVTRNQDFTRSQPYLTDFKQSQYGFAVGGPIVKNKVLFFLNPEFQQRTVPAGGPFIGSSGTSSSNVSQALVDRFNAALNKYGIPSGSGAAVNNDNPLTNVFARLDFNLTDNTSLVLRHNYAQAEDNIFSRSTSTFNLDNNGYFFTSKSQSTAAQLRTNFASGAFNELLVSRNSIRDRRKPNISFAQVEVNTPVGLLVGGGERSSHRNELDQDVLEISDNFSLPIGTAHRLTIGTQNQFYDVRNLFQQQGFGRWIFGSLDSLELGAPRQFAVGVPVSGDGAVRFNARQHAFYVQDEWTVSPTFNLSAGLRMDMPVFGDKPPQNPLIANPICAGTGQPSATCGFARNTSEVPSGNIQWSPRIGFNWDVTGNQKNQLRGGLGLFTGRPAYVWLANAFQNSGLSGVAQLTCNALAAPRMTTGAVATVPTACANGTTAAAGAEINLLDKDLKFPQNMRATLGYDRQLMGGFVGTLEAMYTKGVNNLFYQNIALAGPQGVDYKGRVMYGPNPNAPVLKVTGRTAVLDVQNQSKDYSYSLTAGLARRWRNNFEGSLFYTYSDARDVQSLTSSTANSQYQFGRPVATLQSEPTLGYSVFRQPHRLVGQFSYAFKTKTDVTLTYVGETGAAFTYTVNGDVNGDGFNQNDPIYIPKSSTDPTEIQFRNFTRAGTTTVVTAAEQAAAFDKFINSLDCLNDNRGSFAPRNECNAPWSNTINLSLRQSLKTIGAQNVSFQLDIFNFANFLNKDWGQVNTASFGSQTLLTYGTKTTGNLNAGAIPIFNFDPNFQKWNAQNIRSNYQLQAQLRYSF
ncbi:MAG: TonB-dependent receptor [Gemmatimonadetes bacterium]|nr:TonB-dependent receptor [Gemmatimonadota bacterium]